MALALLAPLASSAEEISSSPDMSSISISGFASLIGGKTLGACAPISDPVVAFSGPCTRFIADYAHDGFYTPSLSLKPESHAGVQLTDRFNPVLSATVQVTSRDQRAEYANLEWAYLSYKATPELTIQAGRKRLPLYYYSDFQDIGYAYSTIRPSADVYGWDVVNYNGASASYSTDVADWSLRAEVLAGAEASKDNAYSRLYYTNKQNLYWHEIVSGTLEFTHDWLSGRVNYTHARFSQSDQINGPVVLYNGRTDGGISLVGAALNADIGNLIIRSEMGVANREVQGYTSRFFLGTAGYRIGQFTPTLGISRYGEGTQVPQFYSTNRDTTTTAAVRYDVMRNVDLKFQVDRLRDNAMPATIGSATLLSAALDIVF